MATRKTIIILGGEEIELRPLNLKTIRAIDIGAAAAPPEDPQEREAFYFDRHVEVIRLAMARSNPQITAEDVLELEADFQEMIAASSKILEASGLKPSGEAKAGAT